jgi:hypothetical protein
MIWRALAKDYNSFMGACVLNGIGAGPAETIQPAVIADIFFLHDRGKWNTLYWVVYMGSLMVGSTAQLFCAHAKSHSRLRLSSPDPWLNTLVGAAFGG